LLELPVIHFVEPGKASALALENEVWMFGDVLVIGDAVALEDVAEVPEFADDVVCRCSKRVMATGRTTP
jgi:hypothetical protein